jgi:hypothetical protein
MSPRLTRIYSFRLTAIRGVAPVNALRSIATSMEPLRFLSAEMLLADERQKPRRANPAAPADPD